MALVAFILVLVVVGAVLGGLVGLLPGEWLPLVVVPAGAWALWGAGTHAGWWGSNQGDDPWLAFLIFGVIILLPSAAAGALVSRRVFHRQGERGVQ